MTAEHICRDEARKQSQSTSVMCLQNLQEPVWFTKKGLSLGREIYLCWQLLVYALYTRPVKTKLDVSAILKDAEPDSSLSCMSLRNLSWLVSSFAQ